MRVDLKHWAAALQLAQRLDPAALPAISKQHAAMLELAGDYQAARGNYQQVRRRTAVPLNYYPTSNFLP